jgi:hypothetical protein
VSRQHRDWTDAERKEAAQVTHAENRLRKLGGVITEAETRLKRLRAERKRLQKVLA